MEWIEEKIKNEDIRYFDYDQFNEISIIGRGRFGIVNKANLANTGLVALKTICSENSEEEHSEFNDEFVKELKLLREVDSHPNINRFLGITKDSEYYILVLEYANEGHLKGYLNKNFASLKWNDKIRMALDIISGLKFLHSKEIIHRDLHSKNILVNNGKLIIADFGLSKKLAEVITNSAGNRYGVVEYVEPQCFKNINYKKDKKSDIYSLGVLLWEISSGRRPYSDCPRNLLNDHIREGNREKPIEGTLPKYQKLYQICWDDKPKSRPDIEEVHEIISQLNIEDTFNLQFPQLNIHNIDDKSKENDHDDLSISSNYSNRIDAVNSCNNDDNVKKFEGIFKSSDYDLDIGERKLKYKDYNIILCEKCNEKFYGYWYCRKCCINETEEEKYRMLYGICKGCSQTMKTLCWCQSCNSNRLRLDFDKWTSGNNYVDELIKDNQASAYSKHILEWIQYENFTDIKFIAEGGFAEVRSATWTNGRIEKWDHGSNIWERSGSFKIALKILKNSRDLNEGFLNELKFLKRFSNYCYKHIVECYGITREPCTLNYALVFELKDCNLRYYLDNHYNSLTLKDKLDIIERICLGLNYIHSCNIIHGDLHSRNILLSSKKISDVSICDFGLCRSVGEIESEDVYGIVPYIAPEVLRGNEFTQASDIYSLGIIINEIIFGNRPFNCTPYDEYLAIDICRGLRPYIRNITPEPLKEIIQKCWDENPRNRPNTDKIYDMLRDYMYTKNEGNKERHYNFRKYTKQYEKAKNLSYDLINEFYDFTIILPILPSE
ncbi:kinase-like protein [Rhizophagus irregularis]|uniref:Kinase-like protein n=1 Tax=Rhizophagus irregularis TaxID=588596 RepID=A0A2N0S088_9GLOM|nr:kinase-like protein [Rhizophagus irregularis]